MKKKYISILLVLFLVLSFSLAFEAKALEDLESISMTIAHNAVADHQEITHAGAYYFKEYVERESNGQITVDISPAAELGDMASLVEMAMRGEIEAITGHTEGPIARVYSDIEVYSIPYLFYSSEHALEVMRGDFGKELFEDMREATGLKLLGLWDNGGFRHFSNSVRPVEKPEDMRGLRIRTMDIPSHMEIVKALEASPTPIAWDELYTALQTGVVDGQENAIPVVIQGSLYEVQDYIILDGHVYSQIHLHCNDGWFNNLPEEYQRIVLDGGRHAEIMAERASRIRNDVGIDIISEHMEIYDPPTEVIDQFRDITQEPVISYIEEIVDPYWVEFILEESDKAAEFLGYN